MSENGHTRDAKPHSHTKSRDGNSDTVLLIHHTHGLIANHWPRDSNNLREYPLVVL